MVLNPNPVYPQTPTNAETKWVAADGTANKTIYTAGANGSKLKSILLTSSQVSTTVNVFIVNNSTSYLIGSAGWGSGPGQSSTVPTLDLMSLMRFSRGLPRDADGNPFLTLISGDTLTATPSQSMLGTETMIIAVQGADF